MFRSGARRFPNLPLDLLLSAVMLGTVANAQSSESRAGVAITPRLPRVAASLPGSTFRLQVNLIQVPVTVADTRDRPLLNLPKTSFRVFEDGIEQQIATFSMADGPVSAGIVFDTSKSMRSRLYQSRAALEQFLQTSVAGDEFSLVRFNNHAELVTRWTRDGDEIARKISGARPEGYTAMIDGIRLSLEQMRRASNPRRVLLVLSDGDDNNSRYSEGEVLSVVREADVRICAVGLFERPRYLQKLANETGGKVMWVHKLSELPDAIQRLSVQIRNEYMLGYFSNQPKNDGRYHKVRVEVQPPAGMKQLHVTWRQGYISPGCM